MRADLFRASDSYRDLGLFEDDEITWFWISTHAEYDQILDERSADPSAQHQYQLRP